MALTAHIRKAIDWLFGRWHEGPDCPTRLVAVLGLWAADHPHATRAEWLAMCERAVRTAYESGWQRGYEHIERTWPGPAVQPEDIADANDAAWRDIPLGQRALRPDDVPTHDFVPRPHDMPFEEARVYLRRRDGLPL